jgi:hypothetical protein
LLLLVIEHIGRLRQAWNDALNDAETRFRQLISSPSNEWKHLQSAESIASKKGKSRSSSLPEVSDVVVHRNSGKSGNDIYRLIVEIPAGEDVVSLEPWRAVLSTPELRQEWDPAVSDAHLVETIGLGLWMNQHIYVLRPLTSGQTFLVCFT